MESNKDIWIFLSHSNADFGKVREIRNYLEEKGFRPLMFYLKCLENEEETFSLIKREIDVRTRFVLCDSENARKSIWVKREMDYISKEDAHRSFLKLDIASPVDAINRQLDEYTNQTKVFISCQSRHPALFKHISNRLGKYDLSIYPKLHPGYSQQRSLEQVRIVADGGFFVLLASSSAIPQRQLAELEEARKIHAKIVPVALSPEAAKKLQEGFDKFDIVPAYAESTANLGVMDDDIADEILWKLLPLGALSTFADNFKSGKNGPQDEKEASRLDKLIVRKAETSGNPSALAFLASCYEHGWHGLPVDLRQASVLLSEAIHVDGRTDLIPRARELHARLLAASGPAQRFPWSFMKRIFRSRGNAK